MANLTVNGIAEFELSMAELAMLPDEVLDEMLFAEGEVIKAEQRRSGEKYGVKDTGKTLDSIGFGKIRRTSSGKSMSVYPIGRNAKKDLTAMVAFLNEYGRKGQRARPFIREANEQGADKAAAAAEKVFENYLKLKGLI